MLLNSKSPIDVIPNKAMITKIRRARNPIILHCNAM